MTTISLKVPDELVSRLDAVASAHMRNLSVRELGEAAI